MAFAKEKAVAPEFSSLKEWFHKFENECWASKLPWILKPVNSVV